MLCYLKSFQHSHINYNQYNHHINYKFKNSHFIYFSQFENKNKNTKINNKINNKITDKNIQYFKYNPRTENQINYCKYLNNNKDFILTVLGPAGTGKTLFACITAIHLLKNNKINKIILTRPAVVNDEDIGFLPGSSDKKMLPFITPILDIFLEFYTQKDINNMLYNNIIEISPLGFMRGRTFKNSFIIADEMQNSSPKQMLMLLTRIGENCKVVVTGDLDQSDLTLKESNKTNGLKDLVDKIKFKNFISNFNDIDIMNYNNTNINLLEMKNEDIQRSQLVIDILKLWTFKTN